MIDYEKLKFKSGLEIHQQLDTKKLFCNCPSFLRQDEPDYEIKRKLHPVAGESGEIDEAAKYQASLNKEFVYQVYEDNCCLVDLDEEPPHEINQEALKIAVQVALLLNCEILPITQIMRKTVIDGSNTSGFQRTVLIAHSGYVETKFGKVGVASVCLEEDAGRVISREKNKEVYRLDRLGIPLVEIATDPDIKNAEQAKEVALFIGDILRSCKVKRGLGTIRQDVNISILGGNRVEVKGVQDMKTFIDVVDNEILRHKSLFDSGKPVSSEVRNALPDGKTEFLRPMPGAARMYPETDLPLLKISRDFINDAKKTMPKLKSEIEEELAKKGLSQEMIKLLFKEQKLEDFKELLLVLDNPNLVAKLILVYVKEVASHNNKTQDEIEKILDKDVIGTILEFVRDKKLEESNIKEVFERIVQGKSVKDSLVFEKKDLNAVEEEIASMIKSKPGLNANAYMGLVMAKFKGKISGGEAMQLINKHLK